MKTTRFFIALSAIISILLFAFGFYDGGVYFIFITACVFILNSALKKNAQLTFKINDAEEKLSELEDELNHSIRTVKLQFQESNDLNLKIISLKSEIEAKKTFEESQRAKQFELLVEISDLKTQLETAKANSYTEVERKRGREKYNRLYKGKNKKKSKKQEPYTIEGKTIKQLVEENLGIKIKTNLKNNYFLCGLESNCKKSDADQIIACNIKSNELLISDRLPYCKSENKVYNWCSYRQLIYAIKKHRNIK